ncbi:MAG TPA: VCBS repeat-containing protein, partial [Thermoanaerobaculia bacterium]
MTRSDRSPVFWKLGTALLLAAAATPAFAGVPACSPTVFQSTPHLVSTSATEFVATADFNGDSHQDLATTGSSSPQIGILLGDGAGAFSPQPSLPANFPHGLEALDVDTDGDIDIVTLDSGELRVYRANGDGSFQSPVSSPTGGNFVGSLVLGLFDADAEPDAVLLDSFDFPPQPSTIRFLKGVGDGTFTLGPTLALPPATGMAAALFDADAEIDLAVSHSSGAISILRGNGDGTFAEQPPIPMSFGVGVPLAADVTGDGDTDIVVPVG